ncbi:hypothetical protein HN51_036609 [Arachis hypogaea]
MIDFFCLLPLSDLQLCDWTVFHLYLILFLSFVLKNYNTTSSFLGSLQILPPCPCWNCVFTGISYNSHTLGSAMRNLTPTITFLLAIIFSQEVYPFSNCIKRYKATRHYSKHVWDTG